MFKGKALLIIDRLEPTNPKEYQWDIHPIILSLNKDDPGGEVDEAFSFIMQYGYHIPPAAAYKMAIGDRIRVAVTFELHFTKGDGWTTDDDSDLYLIKERVLRRQPYNSKKFRKNFYRLLNR